MSFEFSTSARVIFGRGAAGEAGAAAVPFGRRILLVAGRTPARAQRVQDALVASGADVTVWTTDGEPDLDAVSRGAAAMRDAAGDVVVAVGGGSVLDTGKAIAALAANNGDLLDYLEVVGRGQPLVCPSLPVVAVPTTAGTGSEVTRNAVLASPEHGVKVSLRSVHMLPRVAIVDPDLTTGAPRAITATTGLDALTQLIEAFVSCRATPMTDALCVAGIPRAASALPRVCGGSEDPEAREAMSLASLWSGMALANAGLGAVHGFAGPLGGMFNAPHGALCAALLPHVMAGNVAALRRDGHAAALARYDHVAQLVTGHAEASADDGVRWAYDLSRTLELPGLGALGISAADIEGVLPHARRASSMKGNPIALTDEELTEILNAAL